MYTDTSKTNFIPKAPVTTIQQPTSISGTVSSTTIAHGIGFLGWVGVIMLLATVIGAGGLFLYVGYFQSQQVAIVESFKKKQKLVDTKFIADAQRMTTKINSVKELLQKQIYVSPFFEVLHEKTLPSIQFDSFELKEKTPTLGSPETGVYQAILKGKARSYEAIAQQSDVYATAPLLDTHFFSDFKVDTVKNLIGFSLAIDLKSGVPLPASSEVAPVSASNGVSSEGATNPSTQIPVQ